MIGSIRGTLIDKSDDRVVIEASGIGYVVHILHTPVADEQNKVLLWTHLAVRENSLDLYGFSDQRSRALFEALLTVPKIGPKSAMQILQKASPELLLQSIQQQDASGLTKRSGIGTKTAEKIVQALQDDAVLTWNETPATAHDKTDDEAIATLVALGYSERVAHETVQDVKQTDSETNDTKTLVTKSLRMLSTH